MSTNVSYYKSLNNTIYRFNITHVPLDRLSSIMAGDIKTFIAVSIPTMLFFEMRHAVDVDHITAIDNLVRMHNARKRARWVGTGFSFTCGYYSALLIVSEIGDINRFPDSHHLCSYAGLIPSTHSSGGITYHGRITKRGSKYLRWIMLYM